MDSQIISALTGGVVGGVVGAVGTAVLVLYRDRRNQERETRSVATALLWEIDDFYKLSIRNVFRALKDKNPADLNFDVKPLNFVSFTVFEATADKVGLFEPVLVQGVVGFYGNVRAYLDTFSDYRDALEQIRAGRQPNNKAMVLLSQIKGSSESLGPLAKSICELLAARAKMKDYKFDVP